MFWNRAHMRLKEPVGLVSTEMTFTQCEKGAVMSQRLMFNMQQGHVPVNDPVRLNDVLGALFVQKD